MPRIESVAVIGPATLRIEWRGGATDDTDLSGVIARFAPFAPLADPSVFAQVEVVNWGSGIGWPGDLDYSAVNLRKIADIQKFAAQPFTAAMFKEWQSRSNLTIPKTAELFGMGERQIKNYRSGKSPIPRAVQLTVQQFDRDPALLNALYPAGAD
jgi:hypothetical protein